MAGIRRGSTDYSLLIGVKKPVGITSHDCVSKIRRIFGEKRVGHAGTLDPFASGVLPILVGPATKLMSYFHTYDKEYIAGIKFGSRTNTDDLEGEVIESGLPSEELFDEEFARKILQQFLGKHMQMPPQYSAIKVGGVKSYNAARQGLELELREREVTIEEARLLSIEKDYSKACEPIWFVHFEVTSGTYIRSIARDIGQCVGVPAHLCSLSRMKVANIGLDDCYSFDEIEELKGKSAIDPVLALAEHPIIMDECMASKVSNGVILSEQEIKDHTNISEYRDFDIYNSKLLICSKTKLQGIYAYNERKCVFVPECIFSIGVSRGLSNN